MLGVDASAQTPLPMITVVIGDNHTFENMDLGAAAKLLVSAACGVDERDAKEIVELAALGNQKIVAYVPERARYSTSSRNKLPTCQNPVEL